MYWKFENLELTEKLFFREMDGLLLFCGTNVNRLINEAVCVAVSGGSDSLSLLVLSHKWALIHGCKVYCVTVDHQLRKESSEEAKYVSEICKKLGVEHHTLFWKHGIIEDNGKVEVLAREARYRLLSEFCEKRNVSLLAVGHNWNDQIETYELRRSSGSYEHGLAGMSQIKTLTHDLKLIRPLLHFSKEHLQDFLSFQNIEWKIDPMNFQDSFRRVAIRKEMSSRSNLAEVSDLILQCGNKRHEIEALAVEFLKSFCNISDFGFCTIDLKKFEKQTTEIQNEVLKRLIWSIGMKKYPTTVNEDILQRVLNRKLNTLGRCFIKIKKEKIFIFREKRNIPKIFGKSLQKSREGGTNPIIWDNRFLINLRLSGNQYIFSASKNFYPEFSNDILIGFPCLYEDHKVKYNLAEWLKFISFIVKPDLFDVYCGVSCA